MYQGNPTSDFPWISEVKYFHWKAIVTKVTVMLQHCLIRTLLNKVPFIGIKYIPSFQPEGL